MNGPNRITLARILLTPIFLAALLWRPEETAHLPGRAYWAAGIFFLAAATDVWDGYLARSRGLITVLGKFLDPLADKLLVSAALIALVQLQRVEAWLVWLILAREFAVTGLRAVAAAAGTVIAASNLGKAKTVSQTLAVFVLLLPPVLFYPLPADPGLILLYAAAVLTLWSGADYIWRARGALTGR
ncbi:MAG: CDP-diacylglycerol--glycerol-3-phosphate 3-phosphatidyltransferase [Gracilibacteraceae bacterium]|nr:CDP-diacylglycerol--glycerol-3-phosphate 3-phosphatidyltransferase [Gracilibacteraceae bacterium]